MALKLSENARKVLERRYLKKDEQGKIIETPEEMFRRVARAITSADKAYGKSEKEVSGLEEAFYRMMTDLEFMPNSPALMNAGKDLGQLSACFTLPINDSMESIFETLKITSLIHKSGGGCVSKKAKVFTTYCGVEEIGTLYNRLKENELEKKSAGGEHFINLRKNDIYTLSFNSATGRFLRDKVEKIWHYRLPCERVFNLHFEGKSNVSTSDWHPFFVFYDGRIIERRADEMQIGDWVVFSNTSAAENWPFSSCQKLNGIAIDEEMGWLLGYFLGDGSLGKCQGKLRLRFFDESVEPLMKASRILSKISKRTYTIQKDSRNKTRYLVTYNPQVIEFIKEVTGITGEKKDFDLPPLIFKSPLNVVYSFLAGLMDSDGYICNKKIRLNYATASKKFARDLSSLFSLLGFRVSLRSRKPLRQEWAFMYELSLDTHEQLSRLWAGLKNYLVNPLRRQRLEKFGCGTARYSSRPCPLPFSALAPMLEKIGIVTKGSDIHRKSVKIKGSLFWLARWKWRTGVSLDKVLNLINTLLSCKDKLSAEDKRQLEMWRLILPTLQRVISIRRSAYAGDFYDFSVKRNNNYLAGENAFAVVHNTGFSFSRLRAKNSVVFSTGGVASGPVSFMKVYDAATDAVKQGGSRRGANMGILRVDHPDILEFICCKENDKAINNFNISVAITDDFMQKLSKGEDYDLIDPHTHEAVRRLNTREVFELIIKQAHKNGEPGVIFIDRINQYNPTPKLGMIESTNPCLAADTWIMTTDGSCKVKDLIGREFTALVNGEYWRSGEAGFFATGIKPVYKLRTKEGLEIGLTLNHPLLRITKRTRYSIETEWVEAGNLEAGDQVVINNHHSADWGGRYTFQEGYLIGLLIGDGTLKKESVVLSSWGKSPGPEKVRAAAVNSLNGFKHRRDFSGWVEVKERNEFRLRLASFSNFAFSLGLKPGVKQVTEEIEMASADFCRGLARGLFDTDGTVLVNPRKGSSVRLAQSNLSLLQSVQRILLRLGIYSKIYAFRRDEGIHRLPDGKGGYAEYNIRAQHELVISNESILKFAQKIGFEDADKQEKLNKIIKNYKRAVNRDFFAATIEDLVFEGMEEVYDTQIPGLNYFDANGFTVHNCGEQPILPYESCDLGSINLERMVKKSNGRCEIDWEKLSEITRLSVHFLDNLIDVNKFPLSEIEKATKLTRKIGLGVMGWASLLIRLNIPYDSDEAVALAEKVMSFILRKAEKKSLELGKEKGVFPAFRGSIYDKKDNPARLRNATLTTIAPTGTISIIAGPCSSGIEPLFALSYYRNVMDNDKLVEVDPLFEEAAKQRGFYSRQLMEKIAESSSLKDIEGIPEEVKRVFVTAHDISPEWHVRMQSAFQRFTHNATSKTINFPHAAAIDDVRKAYLLAYDLGCKGITIYRDRSREEQVLNVGTIEKQGTAKAEAPAAPKEIAPRPRPEVIIGTTTKVSTGCGNLYVTINVDEEGRPFELFTQMGKAGGCAASQLEAIGRLVSLGFRSGIEVKAIIAQLRNIRCPSPSWEKGQRIFSCADAIARVVERRLINHQAAKEALETAPIAMKHSHEDESVPAVDLAPHAEIVGVCPDCGGALRHEEGCQKCHACGYSKC